MKKIILFLSLFLLSSCTTLPANTRRIKVENTYSKISSQLSKSCFETQTPQFLADLTTSLNTIPPMQLEGIWEQNFNLMKIRFIDPLGKEYGAFNLQDHTLTLETNQDEAAAAEQNFTPFLSFIASIGAKELRNFICGNYAFQKLKSKDGIYYSDDLKQYYSLSTLNLNGEFLDVQSQINLTQRAENHLLILKSKFFYGLFSKDSQVEVTWIGLANRSKHSPSFISFQLNHIVYSILFNDYQ